MKPGHPGHPSHPACSHSLWHTQVHGFIEHIGRYDTSFSLLAERGIEVFGFDQRGYGRTGTEAHALGITSHEKQLADIDYFLSLEAKRAGDAKLFLYGHSMVRAPVFAIQLGARKIAT
jgi:pimeloyl-ACP methyl ester carboxylesterase